MNNKITEKIYEADFPFVRVISKGNFGTDERWKPGFERRHNPPDGGSTYTIATGMGKVFFEVIHVCKMPGRYMDRVFYKRLWITPNGERLGGKKLEVATIRSFLKKTKGFVPENYDETFAVHEGKNEILA